LLNPTTGYNVIMLVPWQARPGVYRLQRPEFDGVLAVTHRTKLATAIPNTKSFKAIARHCGPHLAA
jgi:hypothetical protein